MSERTIGFNKPYMCGTELYYIARAHFNARLAGDGPFTAACHGRLEELAGCARALLTHSCTAALEMSALLLDIRPGDEIVMPSYTFVSTANAFALRGGVPVFVDIREDLPNIDETLIEQAITSRTRAIVPVHYAGVACEMEALLAIAGRHGLKVVEDAAQGFLSRYRGRPLGSLGDLAALSFHETKNVISGEGGALLVNDPALVSRAEIIREKGTDRSRFFRGEADKYTWQELGSSFLPGELVAAFLLAQLERAEEITRRRIAAWNTYHELLAPLEAAGRLARPRIPGGCEHNGHMYYVILPSGVDRSEVLARMAGEGVNAVFHYVPLHDSPAGRRYGRIEGSMRRTESVARRLIRLPLWVEITPSEQQRVAEVLERALAA